MRPHLRVLVVEDSEDDMLLVLRELRRGGYVLDYVRVETSEEMLTVLDRQAWDIVIADYTLPMFSAPAALRLLQAQQRDLPFIIVSGTIEEETAVAAMKAGAHDYITKGNLPRLVPAVERELREAEERQKRYAAERALRESEERFRQLAENISESVFWMANPRAAQFLYVSPAYEHIWGRSCESLYVNFTEWLEAIHPEERHRIQTNFFEQALAGRYDEEYRIVRPDGSVRWIRDRGFPIRDASGYPYRVVGIAEDITDRKLAERKIREQAALIGIATDAIFVCTLENRVLFWNQGAERLYGWSAAETLGQNADDLFQNSASSQLQAGLKAIVEQGTWQGELEQSTKTGQAITVASSWTLVRDEAGQPKSILVVNTDITEKKQLEAQFYRAQRLESIGTLASGIAHDLNNVFTPILALSQLLRLKLKNLDTRSQEMIEVLTSSAERGADLVKQILTFARGTEGKRIPLQVGHLLHEIATIAQQTFPKSIVIRRDVPIQSLWLVSADPTHLHQVLMNLCVNARDAMPRGGTLTFSARNQFIDVTTARMHLDAKVGNYVLITITDTGTGISPELFDRIFDPFFTTKELGEGTGLGLSTVLGIVKNHDGFLQVSSEPGKGTQFQIYLPAIVGATLENTRDEIVLQGSEQVVLIVDDEIAVQQTNQALLENYQFRTLAAYDGREAIDLYRAHQQEIDAVIIDIMMPNMDGLTAIRHLRQINPRAKIIAVSGLPSNRRQVLLAGADVFLSKPYTAQELLMAMQELMAIDGEGSGSDAELPNKQSPI